MNSYLNQRNWQQPTQQEPLNSEQIQNAAGGYGYELSCWDRFNRWLAIGSEGGTCYASESKLTRENITCLDECIAEDAVKVVETLKEWRYRVAKRDQIIYATAVVVAKVCSGNDACAKTKRKLEIYFTDIIRTGTDLFMFCEFVLSMRKWGRFLQRLVGYWYEHHAVRGDSLAYQLLKYQKRGEWTHRKVLRGCHFGVHWRPVAEGFKDEENPANLAAIRWAVGARMERREVFHRENSSTRHYHDVPGLPPMIYGYEQIKKATTVEKVRHYISTYNLTHEMVPTQWLKEPDVWKMLLMKMPMTAMVRNLGRMTSIEALKEFSLQADLVSKRLEDKEYVEKSKIHPLQVLVALKTYESGGGIRGSLKWQPVQQIVNSLHSAFYASFKNLKPSGKNTMLAIDVSGSMGQDIAGYVGLTPAMISAAIALAIANSEPKHLIVGFANGLRHLGIYKNDSLPAAMRKVQDVNFGTTDCALPMRHAHHKNLAVESFVVLTDNETWAGDIHPSEALKEYREHHQKQIPHFAQGSESYKLAENASKATCAVAGMTATNFSIADPNDKGMLDVVGFDANILNTIASHARGEF